MSEASAASTTDPATPPVTAATTADATAPAVTGAADGPAPTAAAAPAVPVAPEKYAFTFPEGVSMDAAVLGTYEAKFRELGLTNDQAQALVSTYTAQNTAALAAADADLQKQTTEWAAAVRNDPEYGGAKYDATVKAAERAIGKFGSPELKSFLDTTGLTNHPGLVKLLAGVGRAMGEDSFVPGAGSGSQPKPMHDRMYPKSH